MMMMIIIQAYPVPVLLSWGQDEVFIVRLHEIVAETVATTARLMVDPALNKSLAFVCFSFFVIFLFLAKCARLADHTRPFSPRSTETLVSHRISIVLFFPHEPLHALNCRLLNPHENNDDNRVMELCAAMRATVMRREWCEADHALAAAEAMTSVSEKRPSLTAAHC